MKQVDSKNSIPVNLRVLRILEIISKSDQPVSSLQLTNELLLPKPTVHRLILTLEREGFIQREINRKGYVVGSRTRTMVSNVFASAQMQKVRQAVLASLAEDIGETCNIAMPDGNAMLYIERVESKWPLRIQLPISSHVPLHATASGKLYLSTLRTRNLRIILKNIEFVPHTRNTITNLADLHSELNKIAKNGYATDNQEFIQGMIAVAVPVVTVDGIMVATLSFHAPEQRLSLSDGLEHLDKLFSTAKEISEVM